MTRRCRQTAADAVVDDVTDDVSQVDYYDNTWRTTTQKLNASPRVDSELTDLMLAENSGSVTTTRTVGRYAAFLYAVTLAWTKR